MVYVRIAIGSLVAGIGSVDVALVCFEDDRWMNRWRLNR